jgi:hypothetical protein
MCSQQVPPPPTPVPSSTGTVPKKQPGRQQRPTNAPGKQNTSTPAASANKKGKIFRRRKYYFVSPALNKPYTIAGH